MSSYVVQGGQCGYSPSAGGQRVVEVELIEVDVDGSLKYWYDSPRCKRLYFPRKRATTNSGTDPMRAIVAFKMSTLWAPGSLQNTPTKPNPSPNRCKHRSDNLVQRFKCNVSNRVAKDSVIMRLESSTGTPCPIDNSFKCSAYKVRACLD